MFDNTITLMKYSLHGNFDYKVMDKFIEPDEVKRLELMMLFSADMENTYGEDYQELWIKNTPIIQVYNKKKQGNTMDGQEKSIELLLKLSENPFYTMSVAEQQKLNEHLLGLDVDITDPVKKKKPSVNSHKNVIVHHKDVVDIHETFPPTNQV